MMPYKQQMITKEAQKQLNQQLFLLLNSNGTKEQTQELLDKGAEINAQNYYKETALIGAAHNGYTEIVELLLKNGTEVNAQNYHKETALIGAAIIRSITRSCCQEFIRLWRNGACPETNRAINTD